MQSQLETIGERIRQRREYLNLSQPEVAKEIGMSPVGFGHWERGRSEPSASQIVELAAVLTVPASWLLGELSNDEFDDEQAAVYYRGLPPPLRSTAREMLRLLYEQSDKEN